MYIYNFCTDTLEGQYTHSLMCMDVMYIYIYRSIRFFDVCPVEHILLRLALSKGDLANDLSELLLNSYFPANKPMEVITARGVRTDPSI